MRRFRTIQKESNTMNILEITAKINLNNKNLQTKRIQVIHTVNFEVMAQIPLTNIPCGMVKQIGDCFCLIF